MWCNVCTLCIIHFTLIILAVCVHKRYEKYMFTRHFCNITFIFLFAKYSHRSNDSNCSNNRDKNCLMLNKLVLAICAIKYL